jgi:26S proteasome regulatory subunit N2
MTLYEEMKNILFTNQAVTGEAAGMGIGMLMAGSGNTQIQQELLEYAKDTQHEKIIRSLSLALAMSCFAKEDSADALIDTLMSE